jgi:hypothetical protein
MQLVFFLLAIIDRCDDKVHKVEGGKVDDNECSNIAPLLYLNISMLLFG